MAAPAPQTAEYRPRLLDPRDPTDRATLRQLTESPGVQTIDLRVGLRAELDRLINPPPGLDPDEERWVYYPWRNALVAVLGPDAFAAIRSDRNRNKLTRDEQRKLRALRVGVVGQSVGHSVAYTLALEGTCGLLRLADFDTIELSNLNRVPTGLFDVGVNKAVVTARRIAELDPYLPVEIWRDGVLAETADEFLDGLSVVVEECDSLDIKFAVREAARRRRVPLLMDTNDRGLFDVERYDLEPGREPFHGLLGATTGAALAGLDTRSKAPHVLRILDPTQLSARMAASLAEVGETITTWPQLGGEVQLGAAIVSAAIRRIGLGTKLSSGRTRIDLEAALDSLAEPGYLDDHTDDHVTGPDDEQPPADPIGAILACAQRAPSGGNSQPWILRADTELIEIALDPTSTTAMDIGLRGSAVAVGAALYNATTAAAAHGLLGDPRLLVDDPSAPLIARLRLRPGSDPELAADYPFALARHTNRRLGDAADLPDSVLPDLARAAGDQAVVHAITGARGLAEVADLLGASDRVRYLSPQLHQQLYAELRWPGEDVRTGIDVRTLDPAPDELAKLQVGSRTDVMDRLREWSAGTALGEFTVDRVRSSSALVAIGFRARGGEPDLADYARAGAAVEKVWLRAQLLGLAVQPVSPVFLYANRREDLRSVSPEFTDTLASIQRRFLDMLEISEDENVALVLRLSYAAAASVRSRRLPVPGSRNDG
ncbi:Rv1355c family protein [Nocardia caishijiensis]|uniref:ThiF family protein n=1 Tax=Nocardia caishijiensis TaxID=184756 RepID=A0ABQ6YSD2_9NOCA|nr:Rv1355c family protein [Nocardia caishijiensis]KAF0848715.1 ThiF family protein [Nocardia caishijiensis]